MTEIEPPAGYPFPDDELVYCSAYSDFDPDANSYIAVARLPESHTVEINGKEHTNTHRLVIHSPTRGPEAFMVNPQADQLALLSAVLNIMAEDSGDGVASAHVPFVEQKAGVEIDFSRGDDDT